MGAAALTVLLPVPADAHHRPGHVRGKTAPLPSSSDGYFEDSYFPPPYFD